MSLPPPDGARPPGRAPAPAAEGARRPGRAARAGQPHSSDIGWRLGLPAVLIVVLQRGLLLLMARAHGHLQLYKWDAVWYRRVALQGYVYPPPPTPGSRHPLPSLAFFPLLPLLGRWLHRLGGMGIDTSLEVAAVLGLPLAAWGIAAVGVHLANRRTALLLVALWGAAPRGLVTILPYSEALFTALAAWCLCALLRQHWWRAAAICAVAGLTRSAAAMLVLTLGVTWLWEHRTHLGRWPVLLRGLLLALLSASGLLAYLLYTAHRTGHWDGYLRVQRDWNMQLGSPLTTVQQIQTSWTSHSPVWWILPWVAAVVVIALVLLLGLAIVRPPLPAWFFAASSTAWTWSAQNYFWSKARFLLPVFPLGLLPAVLLARLPRWAGVLVVAGLTWWSCHVDVLVWAGRRSP